MGSASKRRCGGCPHLAKLWGSRRALSQLQRSLLAHFQERKAASEPLMPLGDGAMCLACGIRTDAPQTHPEAGCLGCPGPPVLLDLRTCELYCTACADYVFDRGFDLALQTALAAAKNGGSQGASGATGADASVSEATAADGGSATHQCVPQRGGAPPELPAAAELPRVLAEGAFRPLAADGFPAGLRGLNNLGNTCFMNSVLQAILHAPLLRNHYLLNRHSKAGCAITADGGYCVNCELDGVFSAAYSGRRSGHSPAQFLHTWWMLAGGGLAGYQQQDAHEFFCFVLEMMAATAGPDNITQRVFGGTLRSDLVCACCGHVSTSHEQFSHLSLDIPPPQQLIAPTILPRPTGGGGGSGSQATAAAAVAAAPAAAVFAAKVATAPAPRSHKKGASGSKADGRTKLVGAAKASHERALARKAAEAAAAAAAAGQVATSDVQSVLQAGGSQPLAGLALGGQGAPPPALQQRVQQNGPAGDHSSEGDAVDLCASDSMSLGASVGAAGGMVGQSGLEAASGIGAHGSVLGMGGDDAQDTLCSPRHRMNGGPALAAIPGGGPAGPAPSWWPKQQQQPGRPAAAAAAPGRPPIPPGMRSGRGVAPGAGAAAKQAGSRQAAASGLAYEGQHHQAGQGDDSGSPDVETAGMQMEVSGLSLSAQNPSVAPPGLLLAGAPPGLPLGPAQQQQDALAAATNLPGTQDGAAAAGAAAAALPPQLAGYYRWPGASLLGCLNRFTHAEQLGAGERWTCERCLSSAHAVKQLSLRHLPPLLVFHAKRFEHAGGLRAVAKKLDTYLSFPLSDLDMRPYLASAVLRSRFRLPPPPPSPALAAKARRASTGQLAAQQQDGQRQQQQRFAVSEGSLRHNRSDTALGGGEAAGANGAAEAANGVSPDPGQYLYDLYAVVCHRGSFQGGHYVAYVRAADRRWYLCDDAWVTASDEEAVRNCQAYMLFYAQKQLLEGC